MEYIYDGANSDEIWSLMSTADQKLFPFNVRLVDWTKCLQGFQFGIRRFFIKEDCLGPDSPYGQLFVKNQVPWFHDIRVANRRNDMFTTKDNMIYFKKVLNQESFKRYISRIASNSYFKKPTKIPKPHAQIYEVNVVKLDMGQAKKQLDMMHSRVTHIGIRTIIWYFNKMMRTAMQGLHVDKESVNKVKELLDTNHKVVLMPIFKSFADPFLYIFIHNHFGLDAPFLFGNDEDTPHIGFMDKWLKTAGYIFSRRSFNQSAQSRYVNSALLKEIVERSKLSLVFQNSERLRTGKFHRRTTADLSVTWLVDAFKSMPEAMSENITLVPVMASYDRIFETGNLTQEMVKGKITELSFAETLQRVRDLKTDSLGEVYIKYLEPIHMKSFIAQHPEKQASFQLTKELYIRQQKQTPVTLNSLISAVLLQEQSESITMKDLL